MQSVRAIDLFDNIDKLYNSEFEKSNNIILDFSGIKSIDLKAIKTLLNIQKVALMNNKSISIENIAPDVNNMLDVIGIKKALSNVATNPILRK